MTTEFQIWKRESSDALGTAYPVCILGKKKVSRKTYYYPIDKGDKPLCTYHIDHIGPLESMAKKQIFTGRCF